ncbi:MAG: TolC family protein, partial [Muribaculaceae bacterium]|nr:TolC family protein [Muribaculaceae bacterium]
MTIRKQRLALLLAVILAVGMPAFAEDEVAGILFLGVMGINPDSIPISREECIDIALSQSPTIRIADLEVKRVNYSKKETVGNLLPTIGFSLSYQRSIELQTIRMNMGGQSQKLKMGSDNTWNTGFSLSLPIIAPTLWKAISISDTQIAQNLESARSSRLELVNQVNKAYYALMLALASKDVIKQNYDIAKYTAEVYRKQFEQGTASEYDVLRSEVQVKNIEPSLLDADISVKQCQLSLNVLMGIDDALNLYPTVTMEDMQKDMYGYLLESKSLAGNSSLRSLELQQKMADQNVTMKKFAWLPTLGASFNVNWLSLSNGPMFRDVDFSPYSSLGISLSVPIFSGGTKWYQLKQAQVQANELALQKENLVNSLNMQVDLALDNINRQAKQIDSSKEGVRQAKKAHDIMLKSFQIGAASYLQLRDSELADTSAQLSYLQSIYNYLVSTSELDLLLGKDSAIQVNSS